MSTESGDTTLDREKLAPVLGRLPSGLFIVSAGDGAGRETAMLASWVQQASFDPPMITIAVNRQRWLNDWIEKSPSIGVSVLAATQRDVLKTFGKGFGPDEPAFAGVETIRGATGLPLLADCLGTLEGTVVSRTAAGDHFLYLAELIAGTAGPRLDREEPLVHIRRNGLKY